MIELDVDYTTGNGFISPTGTLLFFHSSSTDVKLKVSEYIDNIKGQMAYIYKGWLEENQIDYVFEVKITAKKRSIKFTAVIIFENDDEAMAFKLMFT